MSNTDLLKILIPAISSLSCAVVFMWKQQLKLHKETIQWREKNIKALEDRINLLETEGRELSARLVELESENSRLRMQWLVYSSSHDSSPLPLWIKDRNGVVLACNKAYEKHFLRPRGHKASDYVGGVDTCVWPEHIAEQFRQNDQYVLNSETVFDGEETVTLPDGSEQPVRVIKYPRYVAGIDQPFGVSGIAVPVFVGTESL